LPPSSSRNRPDFTIAALPGNGKLFSMVKRLIKRKAKAAPRQPAPAPAPRDPAIDETPIALFDPVQLRSMRALPHSSQSRRLRNYVKSSRIRRQFAAGA
jgi:hypothetical protein